MSSTVTTAASSSRWSDVPFDLLRDISSRLDVATDYVRFHAVCKSWRDTLPPAACRPAFLPWLLARRDDDTGHRKARCVFATKSSSAGGLYVGDRGWVIAPDDGTAACCLFASDDTCPQAHDESNGFADTLAGSSSPARQLPPYPGEMKPWVNRASGTVSGDGTVFLYAFGRAKRPMSYLPLFTALRRPGDTAWTTATRKDHNLWHAIDACSIAYHGGKIVLCRGHQWTVLSATADDDGGKWSGNLFDSGDRYLVESRGELLCVLVRVRIGYDYYRHMEVGARRPSSLPDKVSVSVQALRFGEGDCKPRWVKRDCGSLADRILFLGRLGSFAVDAVPFRGVGGGCVYFVDRTALYSGEWSNLPLERSRVYKYNFLDDSTEMVEQLPAEWNDFRCMWLTPKPALASSEEIREKLKPLSHSSSSRGSCFTIYVGNLAPKVDSRRLRQFFSKHGKVADARVVVDRKTRRSRGFGFVTMENNSAVDEDGPAAHAAAKLNGQRLDGRSLVVKIEDE